jgi:RNA polymerase sigma-70 factor (ECF subfamily)
MDEATDGDLLERWQGGEAAAFDALIARHQAPLLRYARALLPDRSAAEDAVQDAFLRLIQRPPTLPPEARADATAQRALLSAWLHKVARNCCMDQTRGETRRRAREHERALPEPHSGGVEQVEARDTRAAVERGLARLGSDQREVLVLRLLGDKSYREIADITGRKLGTVGWLVSTGLRALSQDLQTALAEQGGLVPPQAGARELERGQAS